MADEHSETEKIGELFHFSPAFDEWLASWQQRLRTGKLSSRDRQALMYRANPAFIPRNHLVEAAIDAAQSNSDFSVFHQLCEVLETPHHYRSELQNFATPASPEQRVQRTFCGT